MSGGLFGLLDHVAVLARLAAARLTTSAPPPVVRRQRLREWSLTTRR
ncbi:Uncharacterised protein [Mycobacterium tuberculosis]|nr:Uncharacterised protein [Mycobacterium tuberculosis]